MSTTQNQNPSSSCQIESSYVDYNICLDEYLKFKNIDKLKDCILRHIEAENIQGLDLVAIAQVDNETACLVKELINGGKLDDSILVDEISRKIVSDIEARIDEHLQKYKKFTLSEQASELASSTATFFSFISLLRDVSQLGHKLLDLAPQFNAKWPPSKASIAQAYLRSSDSTDDDTTSEDLLAALIESSSSDDFLVLSSSLDTISTRDMIKAAMIYIKSHECFTLSHDIQSVVMVLRRIKFIIINILAPKDQMELIARLLTSVKRYNEMNYVFDLFRDKNQFEILLSKGVEKSPELRIALFDYVKKNPEFYPLVTLNFSMFREIAKSLEASANKRLDRFISYRRKATRSASKDIRPRSFSVSARSKEALNLCLVELVDATDCYAKAGCYKKSTDCEKKARLIALQIALMNACDEHINLLELPHTEITDTIVNLDSFVEANIVADAYGSQLAWRQALFKNVIVDGKLDYLDEYCKKYDLTSALVGEIVMLYKQYTDSETIRADHEKRSQTSKSIEAILSKLTDVELRCKIYTQLNLDNAKSLLIKDPAVHAHLKDLRLA